MQKEQSLSREFEWFEKDNAFAYKLKLLDKYKYMKCAFTVTNFLSHDVGDLKSCSFQDE